MDPSDLNEILTDDQLQRLREAWADARAQGAFKTKMGTLLPAVYPTSRPLLEAIQALFYGRLPPDDDQPRDQLSERDRERCIIALLAAREINSNIALHMYIALMLGVSPAEIAHILLLAGIYTGIPSFTDGIEMEVRLLRFLAERLAQQPQRGINPIAPDAMFEAMRAGLDG
ncbi:carboxymuconolactone decarboxylase family protein [bacterium]|nr:carboxymuconolactone decarboxylase family protein [bacterium]